jgi:hypothetical protein
MSNHKILLPFIFIVLSVMACAQDCMGVTFAVAGYIVDADGNPIENARIRVWNEGSFGEQTYNMMTVSNSEGYFQTDDVFSYGCSAFQIEIVADGYQPQTLRYYPPSGEGFTDVLPAEISIELQSTLP